MRPLVLVLPASLILIAGAYGQALTEHAAAAAGAAIGAGAGKGLSNSMTKIFGETDKETAKAAKPDPKKEAKEVKEAKPVTDPAPDPLTAKSKPSPVSAGAAAPTANFGPSAPRGSSQTRSRRKPAPQDETAVVTPASAIAIRPAPAPLPVVEQPIVKVPTAEDVANIKVGASQSDVIAALGQPSSHVIIPDDDGHLREICQYWANGHVLGTIRLDNGQVASVEARPEN